MTNGITYMSNNKQEQEYRKYKAFSFRLDDKTYLSLKEKKEFLNKSWNLFFIDLLKIKKDKKIKIYK